MARAASAVPVAKMEGVNEGSSDIHYGNNVTLTAGTFNNVIRVLVPLVVTDEQFDEGLGVIEAALASVAEHKQPALSHA